LSEFIRDFDRIDSDFIDFVKDVSGEVGGLTGVGGTIGN
jgi:hypothetical protein